ncbi:ABC transporter permease [Streptomyces sp. NBC_01217]|uniref:ABC transporter permease n=1 Tax=Streptomyces sp. NBC_01217 TaxID=2903779 RepID=UPI002E144AA1|nr:ABC transporter permease [Streptomyces sp. NBC_01217]
MAEALLAKEAGAVAAPASGAHLFWRRLRARRAAVVAAVVVALLVLIALAAPLLAGIEGQDPTTYHPDLVDSATGGVPLGSFGGISGEHWLGVEPLTGRDLFARVVYGARVSLGVALGATLVQVITGVGIGLAAGLGNRFVDQALSRVTDVVVALPLMVIALGALAVVPAGFPRPVLIAVIIGLVGWAGTSRVVRAQTLALKSLDHVAAARLSGWNSWQIARRELLPALAAPVITYAVLLFPANIVIEAGLSFLGVGIKPPTPSWGQMLSDADTWYQAAPTYLLIPALLLFVTVLALTVLGEGVRTALDPRAESRLRIGTGRKSAGGGRRSIGTRRKKEAAS